MRTNGNLLNSASIEASLLFPAVDWGAVKIHVAQKSGNIRPIDVFTRSFDEWQNKWNGSYHSNHCWNRKYVFSIIELPNEPNRWLFGGIFKVISHSKKIRKGKEWSFYKVDLESIGEPLIGRLVFRWVKDARAKGRKPDNILPNMSVAEILPEIYAGEDFPGYANINHDFGILEKLWLDRKPDWYAALSHCQGVYLLTDTLTGLRYVGSAYGENGIWSRWETYFNSGGHGNNKLIKELLLQKKPNGTEYARKYFRFSLLEQASSRDSEQYVLIREGFWKTVLLTRGKFGLNDN